MMKSFILVVLVIFVGIALGEKYTTKYDNIDLDQIIKSDRLLKNYLDCILDKGKCTSDGQELKRNLPDALLTDCSKCSDKQKSGTKKILKHLVKNRREWFDEVAAKYDPEGTFRTRNHEEYAKEGIVF